MRESLKCAVIRDLLPSYIDGLTSEITNEEILLHITNCEDCATLLKEMQEPEYLCESDSSEINYLKKIKQRTRLKIGFSVFAVVLISVIICTWRIVFYGFPTAPSTLNYAVSVNGNTVTISGKVEGSSGGYSHVDFSEDAGEVTATVFVSPIRCYWHKDDFTATYPANDTIKTVYLNNLIAYENGQISRNVAEIYQTKTAYIGDMSAANRVANALAIWKKIGPYTNELHTSSTPYGWILHLNDTIPLPSVKSTNDKMTVYACLMIALIDNLGYVSWEYQTENGSETFKVTETDASALIKGDIKQCSETAFSFQKLMKDLGMD